MIKDPDSIAEYIKDAFDKCGSKSGSICVAFSGGADSAVVLKAACEAAENAPFGPVQVYAVTFDTKLHPKADAAAAEKMAGQTGAEHYIIKVNELDNPAILSNPYDRCYLCKKYLFERLLEFAREKGSELVLEGTNADDLKAYRPGIRAVRELGILSPLAELGFTKKEVRECAAAMGLEDAAYRPSSPCLATRIPYNTEISFELLERIDEGEKWMRAEGFDVVRLRVHGDIVRIEIEKGKFDEFMRRSDEITDKMKSLGFVYVTLDAEGFRSGSMDAGIPEEIRQRESLF